MATGFYLLDHANRVKQYGEQRRGGNKPSGTIIIHTAENVADQVGTDLGAESVARYCTTRTSYGAYHRLVDADTIVRMVPFGYETWHCTKTNPWSIGISAAVEAGDWKRYGDAYETRVLRNLARAAADAVRSLKATWGITVPIKHISGAQARAKVPGFTGHGETDPGRRSDPGADFDWPRFLGMVQDELSGKTTDNEEIPDMDATQAKQLSDTNANVKKLLDLLGGRVEDVGTDGLTHGNAHERELIILRRVEAQQLAQKVAPVNVDVDANEVAAALLEVLPKATATAVVNAMHTRLAK